jgi:hypothetical protein
MVKFQFCLFAFLAFLALVTKNAVSVCLDLLIGLHILYLINITKNILKICSEMDSNDINNVLSPDLQTHPVNNGDMNDEAKLMKRQTVSQIQGCPTYGKWKIEIFSRCPC